MRPTPGTDDPIRNLYDALAALVRATEECDNSRDQGVDSYADVMIAARAALAKADGGSPGAPHEEPPR